MSGRLVLAVDGGNSKTYLALLGGDGALLALVRGGQSSPHHLGVEGCLTVLEGLVGEAVRSAGVANLDQVSEVGVFLLAGVDYPSEEHEIATALSARGGRRTRSSATTRSPSSARARPVAGASPSCAEPDQLRGRCAGRTSGPRFPALGSITATGAAATTSASQQSALLREARMAWAHARRSRGDPGPLRSADAGAARRGVSPPRDPDAVGDRLAPVVFAGAADDAVAAEIVERLAEEVVTLARVALDGSI